MQWHMLDLELASDALVATNTVTIDPAPTVLESPSVSEHEREFATTETTGKCG